MSSEPKEGVHCKKWIKNCWLFSLQHNFCDSNVVFTLGVFQLGGPGWGGAICEWQANVRAHVPSTHINGVSARVQAPSTCASEASRVCMYLPSARASGASHVRAWPFLPQSGFEQGDPCLNKAWNEMN